MREFCRGLKVQIRFEFGVNQFWTKLRLGNVRKLRNTLGGLRFVTKPYIAQGICEVLHYEGEGVGGVKKADFRAT
jgi:hypothetical protein